VVTIVGNMEYLNLVIANE